MTLTPNPAYKETSISTLAQSNQGMVARFVCPISMKEMNGKSKFVYIDTCGCVFSEQGLRQVPAGVCVKVRIELFIPQDLIVIGYAF